MSDKLNELIDQRRKLILDYVVQSCNSTVLYGPFRGMKVLRKSCWGDGDLGAKLLGLYENELFDKLNILSSNDDLIQKISNSGYNLVKNNHTYDNRADVLLKIISDYI